MCRQYENLVKLSKPFAKDQIRNYAQVIKLHKGRATYSNGYYLAEVAVRLPQATEEKPFFVSLNSYLPTKDYPDTDAIWPTNKLQQTTVIENPGHHFRLALMLKATKKPVCIGLDGNIMADQAGHRFNIQYLAACLLSVCPTKATYYHDDRILVLDAEDMGRGLVAGMQE